MNAVAVWVIACSVLDRVLRWLLADRKPALPMNTRTTYRRGVWVVASATTAPMTRPMGTGTATQKEWTP